MSFFSERSPSGFFTSLFFATSSVFAIAIGVTVAVTVAIAVPASAQLPAPQATLELEWDVVEGASGYEIKLTPKDSNQPPLVLKVQENRMSQRLPVGSYNLQMRSQDKETGYYGPWSKPTEVEVTAKTVELIVPVNNAELSSPEDRRWSVDFEWSPVPEAKRYILKLWSDDINKFHEFKTRRTSKRLSLLAGRIYFWQVTFESAKAVRYEAAPIIYSFTLLGRQLLMPVVDPKTAEPAIINRSSWTVSPDAEYYKARLMRRALDESEWRSLWEKEKVETTELNFDRLTPGAYRIEVSAHAENRVSSDTGSFEFVVKPTEKELAAALKPVLHLSGRRARGDGAVSRSEDRASNDTPGLHGPVQER